MVRRNSHHRWVVLMILFFCCQQSFGQEADTLVKKLDSLHVEEAKEGVPDNKINSGAYNEDTKITLPGYFILLGSDLKQEVTGPFHSSQKTWIKVGAFAALETGLFFADKPIQKFAVKLSDHNPQIHQVGRYVTNFGGLYEVYTLGALGVYGFVFKKEKIQTATLLATQAYITGGIMESAIKLLAGRRRPNYATAGTISNGVFNGPFSKDASNSSFPSGHTTVAFAAATVYAMEYKNQPVIPVIAYTAATLIGLSRISENKHWATDVLAGAALGYVTGRQVVNNYHRYARLKAKGKRGGSVSWNLQVVDGMLIPGVVYRFD